MKKLLIAILAVVFMGGSAIGAYAYWDSLTNVQSETNIITIGEGLQLQSTTYTIDAATDGTLIPSGNTEKPGDTTAIEVEYTVNLNFVPTAPLNLTVTVTSILVDAVANPYSLVQISDDAPATITEAGVLITFTVTLNEPGDATEYAAVAAKPISFDVTFAASEA